MDGLVQDCGNPIANALELPQSATKQLTLYKAWTREIGCWKAHTILKNWNLADSS